MLPSRSHPQTTGLLAAATVGVYLLVVAGATASLADAARTCSSWPVCQGPLFETSMLVAIGHRVLAAAVGIVVLAAGVSVARGETDRRVRAATFTALVLFPIQVAVGAFLATSGGAAPFPGIHLLVGVGIFGALVLALAWHLEAETGQAEESATAVDAPDPNPVAVTDGAPEPGMETLADRPLHRRVVGRARLYVRLMKPRLMWLLALVAAAAMTLAGQSDLRIETVVLTLGGGVLAIGASGTFNNVLERDRDKRMSRTNDRPIVTDQIPKRNATAFGGLLTAVSLGLFLQVNLLAAALGLVAILFYSVIYTLILKPNTVQNTVIGGAAGALPALIGWAAVTGEVGVPGLALAALIFVWTPAHFYNLALAYKDDYARGGFPMMPVVRGETTTRKHIVLWMGTTFATAIALIWLTNLGWISAAATTVVGTVFLWAVIRLHREQTEEAAFRAFHASNAYLGTFLVAIVIDALAI